MIAQLIVGGFTLPLVAKFGHGDNAKGWQMTMGAVGRRLRRVLRHHVPDDEGAHPAAARAEDRAESRLRESARRTDRGSRCSCSRCRTSCSSRCAAARCSTTSSTTSIKTRLLEFLQRVGLPQASAASPDGGHYADEHVRPDSQRGSSNVASVGFSLFNIASQAVTVLGVVCSTCARDALRQAGRGARGLHADDDLHGGVHPAAADLRSERHTGSSSCARSRYAPTIPLIWAMFADVADYAEWKTGRRTTGVIFATILFALKTGLSLGGAIAGWLLSGYGYQAERGADAACARGHSPDGQRLSRDLPRDRRGLSGLLPHHEVAERADRQ